jgi:nucleoside-diphosphate-sugar epimerase
MKAIRDCSVAVVGGAGFLGSHLVDHLVRDRGCGVLVIDNLVAGRREFVNSRAQFRHSDITASEGYLRQLFVEQRVRFVFNYAAYPYIPVSFARPLHVFNVNATGALKVINAAHEAGCEGILQVSSAEIYGEGRPEIPSGGNFGEDCPVIPHSSYGASKAAIDAMVQVRWREARTPVLALRQFNCVGERETHPYIVPEIISQLAGQQSDAHWLAHAEPGQVEGKTVGSRQEMSNKIGSVQLGNNSFRDFLYAGDAVRMAVELLERGQFGEVYNLGSESGVKVYELAQMIGRLMGFERVEVREDASRKRPWEIWHLQSDNTKIYSAIGARPTVSLDEALGRTVKWFLDHGRKWVWEAP